MIEQFDIEHLAGLGNGAGDVDIVIIYMENPVDITTQEKIE
jgi:hypothetical protein